MTDDPGRPLDHDGGLRDVGSAGIGAERRDEAPRPPLIYWSRSSCQEVDHPEDGLYYIDNGGRIYELVPHVGWMRCSSLPGDAMVMTVHGLGLDVGPGLTQPPEGLLQ